MVPEDQTKYLSNLKDSELMRYGIPPEDRGKYSEPDVFIKKLDEARRHPAVYDAFYIKALYIDPLKPSKKELDNEKQYVNKLTMTNRKQINQAITDNFRKKNEVKGPTIRPFNPGEKEKLAAQRQKFFDMANKGKEK